MTLHMIGIGLGSEQDITLKGLELVKKSDYIYLESYTSMLNCDISALEALYGKKIILADREMVEIKTEIIDNAIDKNVAFLVIGDVFGATTHVDILNRAKEKNIHVEIAHNASILTAVGETGLELYKFGKTTSIPFENKDVTTPIDVYKMNQEMGLHTLFLLDLRPNENKFMTVSQASEYLLAKGVKVGIKHDTKGIACCAMGSKKQIIKVGTLEELKKQSIDAYPQCLIIPGKLHFVEEEFIEQLS